MQEIVEKTPVVELTDLFQKQKVQSKKLRIEPLENRKARLKALRQWIHKNREAIHKAMFDDFRKPAVEVDGIETFHVLNEIKHTLANLDQWAQPKKIDAPMTMLGTRSHVQFEPRGVCLIISPWNYPFSLAVGPLISALAAGNTVVIKPSELTPNVSALLHRMAKELFDPNVVSVCEGAVETAQHLLSLPFDHIFFTGSPSVGKMVMKAAAVNLTSVTLELGGKSPTLITGTANLKDAAERTAVAKFVNNGQTCVAPDYVLIDEKIVDRFIPLFIAQIEKRFRADAASYESSSSYCRIVNDRHFARVSDLIRDAVERGAKIEFGGKLEASSRFIQPMVLSHVHPESKVLQEEIFGPVLPIVTYSKLEDAIRFINEKPKALALYVFSNNDKVTNQVLHETSSGAVCVNDCGIHFLHSNLPFGGVNNSGIGKSHGHYGFLAFSNEKPVMKQRSGLTSIKPFYPPYTNASKKLMDWFLKLF
jgi:aldehyde dehydrogenase (NAD+)